MLSPAGFTGLKMVGCGLEDSTLPGIFGNCALHSTRVAQPGGIHGTQGNRRRCGAYRNLHDEVRVGAHRFRPLFPHGGTVRRCAAAGAAMARRDKRSTRLGRNLQGLPVDRRLSVRLLLARACGPLSGFQGHPDRARCGQLVRIRQRNDLLGRNAGPSRRDAHRRHDEGRDLTTSTAATSAAVPS